MKTLSLLLAFCVAGAIAEGFGNHRHNRNSRRQSRRRGLTSRRGRAFRRGRQDDALAPVSSYGGDISAADPIVDNLADYDAGLNGADAGLNGADAGLDNYVGGAPNDGFAADDFGGDFGGDLGGDLGGDAGLGGVGAAGGDNNLAMLEKSVPGIPGEDYPILSSVPETAFACDGQVEGGYYADPEAFCQVFHICTADGNGGLSKYSFLCPNGTIFNQNYFICDWWFNFDCAEAEALYSINDDIRAEQEANIGAVSADDAGLSAADAGLDVYDNGVDSAPAYDEYSSEVTDDYSEVAEEEYPIYEDSDASTLGPLEITESPLSAYGVESETPIFEETGLSEAAGTGYGAPTLPAEEAREARRRRLQRKGRNGGRRSRVSSRRGRSRSSRRGGRTSFRRNNRNNRNSRRNSRRGRNFRG